jgi:ketosteroid isomerase-like protein
MSQESPTPVLVEFDRFLEAANRSDLDAVMSFFTPDAVWQMRAGGITFEGVAAIRGFWQDWYANYDELEVEPEEILYLGNGVVFAVLIQKARLVGTSGGDLRQRNAVVSV